MNPVFLDLARSGKNRWWRYGITIIFVFLGVLSISIIATTVLMFVVNFDNNPNTFINMHDGQVNGVDSAIIFAYSLLGFLGLLLVLWLAVRFIHRRPFISLITPRQRFDWKRFGQGFGVFMGLAAAASILEMVLFPGRYRLTFETGSFFRFLPVVLVLIPIQAGAEELLFRGYLMQGLGLVWRKFWFPAWFSSLIFMSMHFANPELDSGVLLTLGYYFSMGLLLALVTLKDGRIELAMGAHIANNLFATIFANYVNSALPTPAIFTISKVDAVFNFGVFIPLAVLFYWICMKLKSGAPENAVKDIQS